MHRQPKLLEQVRRAVRARQFSPRTEQAYVGWVRRFVVYHGLRHPTELDGSDVARFLTHLAAERSVSASTQRQAAAALAFLFGEVLQQRIEVPDGVARPRVDRRLPIVLARAEVRLVLEELTGQQRQVAQLLYGAGLRLMEALQLRVKDLRLERGEIVVRCGKGGGDRIGVLPGVLKDVLRRQLDRVRRRHEADLSVGAGWVALPHGLDRKMPGAGRQLAWQFVFPAARLHTDRDTRQRRRHHLHETAVQRAVTEAARRVMPGKR
jgi:integron integrase